MFYLHVWVSGCTVELFHTSSLQQIKWKKSTSDFLLLLKCQCVEFGVFQLQFLTATLTPEWKSTDEPREHFSWWKHYKPLKKPHKPLQPLHNLWWALQLIVNGFHYILWPRFIMAAIRLHWLTVVNISSRLQTEKTALSDNNNHA